MSRPAEPASRRKHGVSAISRRGSSASSRISPPAHRGERDLGGRDGPQVVALEVVGVVGELGQVAGGHHGRRCAPGSAAGPPRRRRRCGRGRAGTGPGPAWPRRPGRAGTSSRTSWPPARGRGCRARRRCPSGAPAGARRSRRGRSPRPGATDVVGLGPRRRGRRRPGGSGSAAGGPRSSGSEPPRPRRRAAAPRRPAAGSRAVSASAAAASPWPAGLAHLLGEGLDLGPELVPPADGGRWPARRARPARSTSAGSMPAPAEGGLHRRPGRPAPAGYRSWRGTVAVRRGRPPPAAGPASGRCAARASARPVPAIECRRPGGPLRRRRLAVDRLSFAAEAGAGRGPARARTGPARPPRSRPSRATAGPTSGTVRVLGLDPVARPPRAGPRIGVMLQRGGVYPGMSPGRGARLFARYYDDPEDPDGLLDRVGLTAVAPHAVAAAVRRRAAAAVAGPGPGGPARGGLPRRAHRRGRPRGPPGHPRRDRRAAGRGRRACCSPPTSSTRPSGWPTGS